MLRYCSNCGGLLAPQRRADSTICRQVCGLCGTVEYRGPTLLVWCYVSWQLEILMCRRAEEPARGRWTPPGGFVESGETLEEACVRELYEEAGVQVPCTSLRLFGVVNLPHLNQVHTGYHVALTEKPLLDPGPEVLEARFFSEADIPLDDLAFRELIAEQYPRDIYACLRTGVFQAFSATVRPPGGSSKRLTICPE